MKGAIFTWSGKKNNHVSITRAKEPTEILGRFVRTPTGSTFEGFWNNNRIRPFSIGELNPEGYRRLYDEGGPDGSRL